MAFLYKDDHCRVCSNQKTVELVMLDEQGEVKATKECDPNTYRTTYSEQMNVGILRIFCSNCGIQYHENSI